MKTPARRIVGIFALGVAVTAGALLVGCSKSREKNLAAANKYFDAGDYEKAEIEYKNVMQATKLDPLAVEWSGLPFLSRSRRIVEDVLGPLSDRFPQPLLKCGSAQVAEIVEDVCKPHPVEDNAPNRVLGSDFLQQ